MMLLKHLLFHYYFHLIEVHFSELNQSVTFVLGDKNLAAAAVG